MDEETPIVDETPATPEDSTVAESDTTPKTSKKKTDKTAKTGSIKFQELIAPLLIAFLFIAGYLVYQITAVRNSTRNLNSRVLKLEQPNKYINDQVNKKGFQAVFLNNGQVYFGKITHIDASTITLEDVYTTPIGSFKADGTAKGDISLSKLNSGAHAQEDKLNIERKNIFLWQNLKSDSKIAKAISDFEKTKK